MGDGAGYDKNKQYSIPFEGGPLDGKAIPMLPADRIAYDEQAPNGNLLKKHFYNLREFVERETGKIVGLKYIHQP